MDKQFNVVNLNQFTWHLNVAIFGGVFAIFSLIYNDYYIYYGLLTFLFGILGHMGYKFLALLLGQDDEKNKEYWKYHVFMVILSIAWIFSLVYFYHLN